jgi:formylmethanofuran dehydrogenase subunit E
MTSYPADLQKVIDFHGHLCPGVLIGYRASLIALRQLDTSPAVDEELVVTVYTDSCAADAVQVMTGCTFGKGNLILKDFGKHVFLFSKRGEAQSLRIALHYGVLDKDAIKTLFDLSDDMLYNISRVETEPPPPAMIYPTIQCSICGEGVMEPKARVKDGNFVCLECAGSLAE